MGRLSDIPLEIAERLDYPAESVAGVPKLTVTGRRRALVENHCGLLAYSRECIIIDGGRTRVCLRGTISRAVCGTAFADACGVGVVALCLAHRRDRK